MPPKRSKAASSQPVSASQPLPEPQKPTRSSTRKRRHSDGSNASDAPSDSGASVALKTPAKKRKRGRPAASEAPDVIIEEDDEMFEFEDPTPACNAQLEGQTAAGGEVEETIEVSQTTRTKHVHFGAEAEEDDDFEKSTNTHVTPHPRAMMTVKRRTLSPSIGGSTKRYKATMTRTSLPPTLTQDEEVDVAQVIQELQFKPLREVLDKRIEEMGASKREASQHLEHNQALDGAADEDELDHNMMVLDSQEEIIYPQLPTAPATPVLHTEHVVKVEGSPSSSAAAAERANWDAERKKYKDAIMILKDQADKATTQLQIFKIELGAIGFGEEGAASEIVIQSIREAFAGVREFLDAELPDTLPEDASNEELVDILVANVREFANRLRVMDKELREKGTLAADLGNQIHGLVDHLAEKEIENRRVSTRFSQLDESHDEKERTIADLEQQLSTVETERDGREEERVDETTRANGLEYERNDLQKSLDTLTLSLENYRNEETRLTALVTKLEQEHTEKVTSMNREREETVRQLDDQLDEQVQKCTAADKKIGEHETAIDYLSTRIQDTEAERDELQQQLEATKAALDVEVEDRDGAEANLKVKEAEAKELEERVDRLEVELDELQEQQKKLRELNEAERQQREAAETELDDRNAEIEDISKKLQTSGKEANELRLRLHNAQTENEKHVKHLQEQMSERDERYQADMAAEVERREGADEVAQQRAAEISDLQARLSETEQTMAKLLKEKDDRIAELEETLEQKDVELQTLQESLDAAEIENNTQKEQDQTRIEELEVNIEALQTTITGHEKTIEELNEEADEIDKTQVESITERDTKIAELGTQLTALRAKVEDLEGEKTGLEHRVEQEAEQLLFFQNEKTDEIEALRNTIRDKQDKILRVEETAHAADQRWQELLAARDEEVVELEATKLTSTKAIAGLTEQNAEIKRRFDKYIRRTSDKIAILQEHINNTADVVDNQANEMKDEGAALLEELEHLNVPTGHQVVVQAQHKAVKNTKGKKKRVDDSGIGLDGELNGEMMEA